jgi:hypothetical protein
MEWAKLCAEIGRSEEKQSGAGDEERMPKRVK